MVILKYNNVKIGLSIILFLLGLSVYAQTTSISGVINSYLQVTAITSGCGTCNSACSPTFTLSSVSGLSATTGAAGNKVLIIQMQAGSLGVVNNGSSFQFSSSYGQVSNYGGAGNYEFAFISSISGSTISFTVPLINTYDVSGKVQVIPVPQYVDANTTGIVTGSAWNGNTGGVLVFECSGTLTQNHNITMDGLGFRGGACKTGLIACCNSQGGNPSSNPIIGISTLAYAYYWDETSVTGSACNNEKNYGANKGEGIFPLIVTQQIGRGAFANGGGGGSGHNSGGGGGGNGTAGGKGGIEYFQCAARVSDDVGGIGGYALPSSCPLTSVFMGGGGGAGHNDNGNCPALTGGTGGGIIIISANTLNTTSGIITSKGTTPGSAFSDGAAGGGAGGSIFLSINSYSGSPNINASGGNGGNNGTGSPSCHAPGGGGGAGVINVKGSSLPGGVTFTVNGGTAGTNNVTCGSMNSLGASSNTACTNLVLNQNDCSLPVILLDFVISSANNYAVVLTWKTAMELNNGYFEIQRSNDLTYWISIGEVKGNGTTNSLSNYTFTDNSPSGEIVYYRLKQVDMDGKSEYSVIREANLHTYKSWMNVYITPDTKALEVQLYSNLGGNSKVIEMYLYDVVGRIVAQRSVQVDPGVNNISFPIQGLESAVYILRLNSDEFRIKKVSVI